MKTIILTLFFYSIGVLIYSQSNVKHQIIYYSNTDSIIKYQMDKYEKGFNHFRQVENNLMYVSPKSHIDSTYNILLTGSISEQYIPIDEKLLENMDTIFQYYNFKIDFDSTKYKQLPKHLKKLYTNLTIQNDVELSFHIDKLNLDKKNEDFLGRYYYNYPKGLGMLVRFFLNKNIVEMEVFLFEVTSYGKYNVIRNELIKLPKSKSEKIIDYSYKLEEYDCMSCPFYDTELIFTAKNRFIFSRGCLRDYGMGKISKELKKTMNYIDYLLFKYSESRGIFHQSFL